MMRDDLQCEEFEQDCELDDYSRYKIGITETSWIPCEQNFKNMLRLVAYDIANPKRLREVAKVCEDYGIRIEKSVFECDLSETHFKAFWREINEYIQPEEDALSSYSICKSCIKEVKSAGTIVRPGPVLVYLP